MKKFLISAVLILAVISSVFLISYAENEPFEATLAGAAYVDPGEEVLYTLTIGNVAEGKNFYGFVGDLTFDTAMFEFVSCELDAQNTTVDTSLWNFGNLDVQSDNKTIAIDFVQDGMFEGSPDPLAKGKAIVLLLKLKVKASPAETGTVTVSTMEGSDEYGGNREAGKGNTLTVGLVQKLDAPTNLTWEEGVAKWDAVTNAADYTVELFRNGASYKDVTSTEGSASYDFTADLTESGTYTFKVTALPDPDNEAYSPCESGFSEGKKVVAPLKAPKIKLTRDFENGGFKYQITDANETGAAGQFIIRLYAAGSDTVVKEITVSSQEMAGHIACDGTVLVTNTKYLAKVIAMPAMEGDHALSNEGEASETVVAVPKVTAVTFKTKPKLSYIEGERLDLTATVITLTYENNTSEDVAYANFADRSLSANLTTGTYLALTDNGKKLTVTYGNLSASETLLVESSECKHNGEKEIERIEPTCGKQGYEQTICKLCNMAIDTVIVPATGEHSYSDWEIILNPSATMNGLREKTCSGCGHKVEEIIPAGSFTETTTGSTAPDQTQPIVTDPPITTITPAVTTGSSKPGMNDMSKIFLGVVLGIFALIVLFFVLAFWMESRRSKRRRSAARAQAQRNRNRNAQMQNRRPRR